jgi:NADH:ubiquinone reductase (H+-translocating)
MTAGGRPRVVVVGGGFAGLAAVRELAGADVDVLLVDRAPYTTFQPLLYQVATGGLNPGDITYSLRTFVSRFRGTRFRRATVVGLDPDRRCLQTDTGADIPYDYLVLCCGVTANYFGIPGAKEHAKTIYSRRAAIDVRDRVFANLEAVVQGLPGAVEPVIVIVGGGPTGVEMAGTLAELRSTALAKAYPELDISRVRIILVEMTDVVLGSFAPSLQEYAVRELERRGVELRLGTAVTEVQKDWVVLSDGEKLPSAATIWATGVKAPDYLSEWGLPQGRSGRIQVEPDMRVVGHPEIFAVGDVAGSADGDAALPQLAQPAIQGGRHAGAQIRRLLADQPTEPLRYKDKGIMATIGRSDAVVQLPIGLKLKGLVAWLAWLLLHIVMLTGQRNRLATLANLSVRYLAWPVGRNVIVGDPPGD